MAGKPGMKWKWKKSEKNGAENNDGVSTSPGGADPGNPGLPFNPDIPSPSGDNGGSSDNPAGQKTGNNLEKKSTGAKPIRVEFDTEKLKEAFPKFIRLALKALNNLFRGLSAFPFFPFRVSFDDLLPEEENLVKETGWPGFEAVLPVAVKKYPMWCLNAFLGLLLLGKAKIELKPKPVPKQNLRIAPTLNPNAEGGGNKKEVDNAEK
jgi:hypothetical protein